MNFILDDKYYFLKELLKLNIKNNKDKIKFILISSKFNDLVDKKISTIIFYDLKEVRINLSACLYYEKLDQELIINHLKYEDANSSELINKHTDYMQIIKEVINKYNL